MPLSVALIDCHPIAIEGVSNILKSRLGLSIVATGRTAWDALRIADEHRPALMTLDLAAFGENLENASKIATRCPNTRIIALTAMPDIDSALRALAVGARGYLPKTCDVDELVAATKAVLRGDIYIPQSFAAEVARALRTVRKPPTPLIKLSVREDQIVSLLLKGRSNKEIASRLGLTERTVKHYMANLMQKLNARNRVEVAIAVQKFRRMTGPSFHLPQNQIQKQDRMLAPR